MVWHAAALFQRCRSTTMKVGLLIQNNLWFCPYVNIYTELLKEWNVDYDLIFWNRDKKDGETGIAYNGIVANGRFKKLIGYWNYGKFLEKIIKQKEYDRLIVFSPQIGIFISKFLKKHYYKKYIFDYRDLSIEQYGFLRKPFERLLYYSYANVISSPGFKKCLPKKDYIISHNFIASEVEKAIVNNVPQYSTNPTEILTIGGIRDFDSNSQIISSVANVDGFEMKFVGRGPAKEQLESYAKSNDVKNITFEGYYEKADEPNYILKSSFLNIFYPDIITHATALSNRFYNSLIYRRPMIVTKGQIQGDYAERYNVGIALENPSDLPELIDKWIRTVDFETYQKNCINLLNRFMKDYDNFKNCLRSFLE